MRNIFGYLAALAVAVDALPHPDSYEDEVPIIETCDGIDSKSKENWGKYSLGEWFVVKAGAEGVYTQDIQKTVQSWGNNGTGMYGFYCSPISHCDGNFDKDACEDHEADKVRPWLFFILWSIRNFNNWMVSLVTAVDHTAGVADGMAGKLVDTFSNNVEDVPLSTAGSVLAAGVMGSIGAIIPAAGQVAGLGGAISTIATGIMATINDDQDVELEPKFNDFSEITEYIAKASETMQKSLESYTRWLLTSIPENDQSKGVKYTDDPKSLPNVLHDGDFAEPKTSDVLPDGIYVSLFSAAISVLWGNEAAAVVKVAHDDPSLSIPPCEDGEMFNGNKWCNDAGDAYLLLSWPSKTWFNNPWDDNLPSSFQDLKGIDKLEDYRMSIETVVKASENAASLNDGNPYYEWDPEKVIDHMAKDDANLEQFAAFNLPFCDLGTLAGGIDDENCDGECQVAWRMKSCFNTDELKDKGFDVINFQNLCDFTNCDLCIGGTVLTKGC